MDGFPSGQRGQTVNLLQIASVVRIHLHPFALMSSMERCLARKSMQSSITQCVRWCGGIGRRKGLKIPRGQLRAGSSPATSSINRAGFRLVILRGLFLCFLYKNSSALLCFSQQGACFVDYSFVFSVSGASSAEVLFVWGWGSSFTTGIKRLANLFLPRLRT